MDFFTTEWREGAFHLTIYEGRDARYIGRIHMSEYIELQKVRHLSVISDKLNYLLDKLDGLSPGASK